MMLLGGEELLFFLGLLVASSFMVQCVVVGGQNPGRYIPPHLRGANRDGPTPGSGRGGPMQGRNSPGGPHRGGGPPHGAYPGRIICI